MDQHTLRIYPPQAVEPSEKGEIYSHLWFPSHVGANAWRPYVLTNIVSTVDGRTAVEGKASGIGSTADRRVMRTLRSKADAVMIGGGTLRAEKLSLGLDEEDPRPRPLAVVLTNTGDVPLARNLLRDERQRVLVLLSETADKGTEQRVGDIAEVRRVVPTTSGEIDLVEALRTLKSDYNVERLLVEGGPTLNHALISSDLTDELFLTLAPTFLGASTPNAPPITSGALIEPRSLRLLSAYLHTNELFLRYALY